MAAVRRARPRSVLDLATGSGDVAFALERGLPPGVRVVGMDFCAPMLAEADRKKSRRPGSHPGLEFRHGDALALPLDDGDYDAVTMAFGLRNMADRARCLSEIRRVLSPGGSLFVLEFSRPWPWVRPLYAFHLRRVVPGLAGALTGDRGAYEYLGDSIGSFPGRDALADEIRAAGFSAVTARAMTMGIVALHVGLRGPAA